MTTLMTPAREEYLFFRDQFQAQLANREARKEARHAQWRKIFWSENAKAIYVALMAIAGLAISVAIPGLPFVVIACAIPILLLKAISGPPWR